ncbi:MAG: Gfo/Idh/MocA family oxidoreductase, partial [Gemmatimonadaceae bacterium]
MSVAPAVGVGLVGYGLGGASFHAPLIATAPGLRLAAIVTGDADRQAQARRDHPEAQVVPDVERLWDPALGVELVTISTPNRTHAPLALSALAAGRHVVVDKPFAPTAAEAARVVDAARRAERLVTVYQNRRWDGDFRTLRRLLAEGALGAPLRFESRFERWRPTPKGDWRERADPAEAGGLLFDLGSHLVDQAIQLFGPVRSVYAELGIRRPGAQIDD